MLFERQKNFSKAVDTSASHTVLIFDSFGITSEKRNDTQKNNHGNQTGIIGGVGPQRFHSESTHEHVRGHSVRAEE